MSRQRTFLELLVELGQQVSVSVGALLEARDALAATIAWLEGLAPTRSRVARLRALRLAHERLCHELRRKGIA